MTSFSLKKILNCLVRDSKNHPDLAEMFSEALKVSYEQKMCTLDIIADNIEISGPEWNYWFYAKLTLPNKLENFIEVKTNGKELAEVLVNQLDEDNE